MILDPFCSFSGEDFTPEAHGFCISGAKSYLQCADRTRNFPEVPKEYLRLVGHSLAGALVARSVSLQYGFLTEIWLYDVKSWKSHRIYLTEFCEITSASLSPDFSFLMYTTISTRKTQQGISSPENFETIIVDLRVPVQSIRYVFFSGKDYQQGYFFPDFSEDYLHFVLYVEKASLKYFTLQRQQIDGPLDPKKQSKKFKPPEHDSTFEEPLWISIENDRVYAILARESSTRFFLVAHSYSIGSKPKLLMEHYLSHFYSPPPPYPHIPLLPSFSFLNGTRNPNLVLKLIRIRSESYVLVQQHFVRPPLFPDQQLFASCLYSVNKYTTALMEMTSEKTEEAKHENTIITDRINTLWQSTQQDSRDEHNPDIFSHGSPSLSMSGSQAFNLSLPLSQLLQIAAPFLTIETEIINSISKKYLDTLSLVDLFVLREMNTRKHQVFVPFVTATTDPIQSHSFVETINSISSYLTQRNQTNPNNGPDIPTKEVVNILHKSTAKDILVQHSQSNLSSPQYTFRAHQSSYSQSTLSSSRSATTTNQVTSLSSLITSHSLIFAPYKDLIFMTHPTHFTLILDFAPQHPPTVSLCLSNSVLFKSLPKSSRPLDPLTTHFTAEKFGFGQSQRTTVLFQSNDNSTETPLNSPMSLSSFQTQNTSKPQPHMYFPFHIHTIPHHPPSSVHSSNPLTGHSIPKSFFSGKSLTRSRIFNVPHERKTNTSYLDLSTSSFFDQSIASSVSQTADPPLASSLILSYATDASPETIFPTIPSSDQTSQSLTLPTSSTRSRPTHTKNTPSPLSKLKTFFSRRRKDQLDDDFLFHHTSLHSVPDSVIRTLFPGQQEEKNLEPRKSIVPSRMVSSSTLMESPLSHSSSPMSQSTISLDSTPLGFKQRSLSPPSFIPHPLATITASPPLRYAQAISQYHAERKLHKNFEVEDKLSPETKSGTTKYSAYPSLDDAEMNIYQPTVPLNYTFDRITQTDQFEHFLLDATTGIVSQYHFNFRHIVESLTNLTPNTVTTLLHILLIHLNDTNLTRVLLRRYFLNSNVTMAPSIFHEILLALPFRALLEKEAFASMTELGQVLFTTSMRIQNLLKVGNIIMGRGTEGERYGVRMEIRDFAGWNGNNRDSFIPSKTGIGEKGNSFHYLWKLLNSLTLKVIDEQLETNTEEDRHHQLNNLKNYLLGFSSSSETDKKEEGSKLSITEPISVDDLFSPLSTSDENRLNWNDTEIELQKRRRNRRTDALYEMEDRIHTTLLGDQSLLPFSSPRRHHHFLTRGVQPMLKKGIAAPLAVDQNPNNALNDLADFIESMIFLDERSKTEKTSKRAVSFVVDGTSPMSKSISAANDEISDRDRTLAETFKHEIKEAIEQRKRERMEALFGVDDQPLREPSNPLSTPDRNTSNPKPHPFLIFNLFTDQPLEQMPSHGLSQFIMQRSAEKLMKQRHPNSHNGRLSDSSPRHGIFPASSPTLSYVADNVDWDAFEENLSDDDRSSDASLDLDERPSHQTAPPNQPKPGHAMMEMFEAEKTSERQHAPSTTVVGSLNSACEDPERRETDERMPLETDEESSADSKSDSSNDSDDQSPTVSYHRQTHKTHPGRPSNRPSLISNISPEQSYNSFTSPKRPLARSLSGTKRRSNGPNQTSPMTYPVGMSPHSSPLMYPNGVPNQFGTSLQFSQSSPNTGPSPSTSILTFTQATNTFDKNPLMQPLPQNGMISPTQYPSSFHSSPHSHSPSSSVHLSSSPELPDPNGSPLQTHRDSLPHQSHHPSTRIATTSISDIPLLPPSLEDSKVYHDEQIRRSTDYFYMLDLIATNTRDDESKYHNYAQPSLSPMIARELSPRAPPRTQKPLKSKQSILSRRHPRFESFPSFLSYFASLFLDVEESNGIEAVKAVISHVRHRKREKELIIRYLIALKELRIETSPSIEERTGQNLETICNLFPTSWLQLLRHNLVPYSLSDLVDAIHQNGMFTMSHASSFPPSMPTFSPFNSFKIIRIGTITDKSHPYVPLKSVISPTARYFSPNVVFVTPSYFNLITPFHQNLPVDSSLPYSLQTPIRAPPDDSLVTPIPNPLTDI